MMLVIALLQTPYNIIDNHHNHYHQSVPASPFHEMKGMMSMTLTQYHTMTMTMYCFRLLPWWMAVTWLGRVGQFNKRDDNSSALLISLSLVVGERWRGLEAATATTTSRVKCLASNYPNTKSVDAFPVGTSASNRRINLGKIWHGPASSPRARHSSHLLIICWTTLSSICPSSIN